MLPRRLTLVLLIAALGCGGSTLTGKSLDDIRSTLQGKDAKAVMSLMGKPTGVTEAVGDIDEIWIYLAAARHPTTGTKMTVAVNFRKGRVVKIEGF